MIHCSAAILAHLLGFYHVCISEAGKWSHSQHSQAQWLHNCRHGTIPFISLETSAAAHWRHPKRAARRTQGAPKGVPPPSSSHLPIPACSHDEMAQDETRSQMAKTLPNSRFISYFSSFYLANYCFFIFSTSPPLQCARLRRQPEVNKNIHYGAQARDAYDYIPTFKA